MLHRYLVFVFGLSLILVLTACEQISPPDKLRLTDSAKLPSPTRALSVSPPPTALATRLPTITYAPVLTATPTSESSVITKAIAFAETHQLPFGQYDEINYMISDDSYIYWIAAFGGTIYRYPLSGGQIETVTVTQYSEGSLAMVRPLRSGDWLVFADVKRQTLATPFTLRARNLRTSREEQLAINQAEDFPPPTFNVAGDWVVWTLLEKSKTINCQGGETVVAMYNLQTKEHRELDRACIDNKYLWNANSPIGISSSHVVVDQMLPDAQGAGRRIYLFDLNKGTSTSLTGDKNGMFPALSEDWVVWKIMKDANDPSGNTMVLNLKTGERKEVPTSDQADEPYIADNRWLYWDDLGRNEHTIYDLTTDESFTFTTTTNNDAHTGGWQIGGNTIVWSVIVVDPNKPQNRDVSLEWKIGKDIKSLLTPLSR